MHTLHNKHIVIGIGGGVAAYKSVDLIRMLREAGALVRVVMTESATAFVTPLTFQAISQQPVYQHLFNTHADTGMDHIELARWADAVLIAPATANRMAKLATGMADDLLSTLCLATAAPIILAPAMNQQMWQAAATQANYRTLQERGIHFLGPAVGAQACGDFGPGRMLEPAELLSGLSQFFTSSAALHNKRVLITAGPTREAIDPVRFISNRSSGKMGYAMAAAAAQAGATVTLISGPVALTCPPHVTRVMVTSAEQMQQAVFANLAQQDIFIATAAVADYQPTTPAPHKIKKNAATFTLQLTQTPDILAAVAAQPEPPFTVGFAAETQDVLANAQHKWAAKKVDILIANAVDSPDTGFDVDYNTVTVLSRRGITTFSRSLKQYLAADLIQLIAENYAYERQPTLYSS